MRVGLVLVGAGEGRRLGLSEAKAFVDLGGKPLLARALEAVQAEPRLAAVVAVVPAGREAEARAALRPVLREEVDLTVVAGGEERQESVLRGLRALPATCGVVVIHDAARPFVSRRTLEDCIDAAIEHGAATTAVRATDTVKEVDEAGDVVRTLDRSRLWTVQTPQAFATELLLRAHALAVNEGITATDDASLVERYGSRVRAVAGDAGNTKITTAEDLAWARWRLQREPR